MKKILYILFIFSYYAFWSQTNLPSTENYIYSKNCLNTDCSKKTESIQYFDGLGRLKQNILVAATPAGKDVVIPVEYDNYGRQLKNYLPIPQQSTQNGGFYNNPLSAATAIYDIEKIYSEKILEASPLGRITEEKSPGNDWDKHFVIKSYATNLAGEVKKYTVSTTWVDGRTNSTLTQDGTYPAAKLYKTTITDEDGNIVIEYKNKKGQIIMSRRTDGSLNLDTYFVYNEYGHKVFVISPLASVVDPIDITDLNNLCYQYRYDGWNRLVEKKLPGKEWEYIVYDKSDRVVATKDSQNPWIFSKYDQQGRVVYTGLADLGSRIAVQATLDNLSGVVASNNEIRTSSAFSHSGMQIYYSNLAYPTNIISVLSVNYYDTYPTGSPAMPSQILGQNILPQDAQNSAISTKSFLTASYVKNIDNNNWTKNYIWYDHKGRVLGTHSINHLGGYTKTESQLDFVGIKQQSIIKHKRLDTDTEKVITQSFTYDNQNRLLVHKHQVNNNAEEILSQNVYNELSQITSKKVGGANISSPLQTVDYSYNIRGWITGVNDPNNLGNDLFGYTLKYQNPENSDARYNGNISEIDWKKNSSYSASPLRRYSYYYDNVNRLERALFSAPNSTIPQNAHYNEEVNYDANGNITGLKRNAPSFNGVDANLIDDLIYHYDGNKLLSVDDKSGNHTGYEGGMNMIDYDDNGNMITMPDKMIDQIDYNFLNLPTQIKINNNHKKVDYFYRADGTKLRKNFIVTDGIGQMYVSSIEYLDGFQYASSNGDELWALFKEAGGGAYEEEAFAEFLNTANYDNILKFVPTAEGIYDFENNQYIYQYKDHLGNVRVSYQKVGNNLAVTDSNDYYAFGMSFVRNDEDAMFGTGSYVNYKYNGKELQETGMYDYGWRHYMADLGRWNGIDQLAEMYVSTSTYAYVANNPVMRFDVDGRWFNEDGTIDTSGRTPSFVTGKQYRESFLGANTNNGGGGERISMELFDKIFNLGGDWFNTGYGFESLDHIYLGYKGNYISLNTLLDGFIDIPEVVLNGDSSGWGDQIFGHFKSFMDNWYSNGGKINWFVSSGGSALQNTVGSFRLTNGAYNGSVFSPKYYQSAWTGGSRARITTYNIGKIGGVIGHASFGTAIIMDGIGVYNWSQNPNSSNAVHPVKAGVNTAIGLYSLKVNPALGIVYFGVDSFYPGGWIGNGTHPGAIIDVSRMIEANQRVVPGFNIYRDMPGGF